jgi:hypothetical protein
MSGVPVVVTKPSPVGSQVSRRPVVTTDASGSFSYSKTIYRTGTWTFAFLGRTIVGEGRDDVIECLPSSVELTIRVRRA